MGGGGVGTGKGTVKSMRKRLSELPLSKLPFSFSKMLRSSSILHLAILVGPHDPRFAAQ